MNPRAIPTGNEKRVEGGMDGWMGCLGDGGDWIECLGFGFSGKTSGERLLNII